ncbi:MAG TPA: hypothetical protein VEW04_10045 [Allosphingosinicella sp.]|nr:hypothetical protein [Allosphingosinicella sp.]
MALLGLLALAAATALPPPAAPARTSSASLSVGATVVRPDIPPQINIANGRAVVGNVGNVVVSAVGGTVERGQGGTLIVTPAGAGPVIVTLTY